MSRPNKAQITYTVGQGDDAVESTLRFHSVISEEHEATTEVTKYPVQSGFNVSNHAIKKNHKVSITGVVTNHLVIGAEEFHEYGGNNSRLMFSTLKGLVRGAVPCKVQTNYGSYSPVIFTRLKTKLEAGKTDSLEFTLMGEEIQESTAVNGTTPNLLVFTPLTDAERAARVDELAKAGLEVSDEAVITQATCDMNESFQYETKATNGETIIVTHEKDSYDPTTKQYKHTVHTSDTNVAPTPEPESTLNWVSVFLADADEEGETSVLPDVDLEAGANTMSACLVDGLIGLGTELAEEYITTALGDLKKTVYGAAYEVFGVNGDQSAGQVLLALGVDCLVAGAIGSVSPETVNEDDFQDNTIPTSEEALEGAASIGDGVTTDVLGVAAPTTLTKVSSPDGNTSFFGDLL